MHRNDVVFTALQLSHQAAHGKPAPQDNNKKAELGSQTRLWFLKLAEDMMEHGTQIGSINMSVKTLLAGVQDPQQYLKRMHPPITSKRQWGGFGEALVCAYYWKVQIAFFTLNTDGSIALMSEIYGSPSPHQICLLWTGSHYESLQLSDTAWQLVMETQ